MPARPRLLLAAALASLAAVLAATGAAVAGADRGQPPSRFVASSRVVNDAFVPGRAYRGDFPDPAVLRVGRTYYAYSTTFAGMNLPVVRSTDLLHWTAVGEGQQAVPSWSLSRRTARGSTATTWAPSVTKVGGWYLHAYAVRVPPARPHKMCISISRSRHPWGGFTDSSRKPQVCPGAVGAIDPQFYTSPAGHPFLLWKSDQRGDRPAELWVTALSPDGQHLDGPNHKLLQVHEPWEGGIIENPSMIRFHGRTYLFYSGGSFDDPSYATGYAVCASTFGPCTRMGTGPLLTSGGRVDGPGGSMAFYDAGLHLRLAYAAWDHGHTGYPATTACLRTSYGCNQRRLHVATLGASTDPAAAPGTLVVTSRG